jgi:hypothetical protein
LVSVLLSAVLGMLMDALRCFMKAAICSWIGDLPRV